MSFNSREYEWADVMLVLGGKDITRIRAVEYKTTQDKELVYGKGNKPLAIQKGNFDYSGSFSVLQSELETLRANAEGRNILNLNLDAIVSYGNPSRGDVMVVDKITGIEFTEEAKSIKQGDKFQEISLPFICLDIKPLV